MSAFGPLTRSLVLTAALLSLAGCETASSFRESFNNLKFPGFAQKTAAPAEIKVDENGCPQVTVVDDLRALSEFNDYSRAGEKTLVSKITMVDAKTACTMGRETIAIAIQLSFDGELGPKARQSKTDKPQFAYPYFIAVTKADGTIIAKEIFAVSALYDKGKDTQRKIESLRQMIPFDPADGKPKYNVLAGFQLSEEQLAYNREHPETTRPPAAPMVAEAPPAPPPAPPASAFKAVPEPAQKADAAAPEERNDITVNNADSAPSITIRDNAPPSVTPAPAGSASASSSSAPVPEKKPAPEVKKAETAPTTAPPAKTPVAAAAPKPVEKPEAKTAVAKPAAAPAVAAAPKVAEKAAAVEPSAGVKKTAAAPSPAAAAAKALKVEPKPAAKSEPAKTEPAPVIDITAPME